jgi:hypothetical protein
MAEVKSIPSFVKIILNVSLPVTRYLGLFRKEYLSI